jgi:hypothetical protein
VRIYEGSPRQDWEEVLRSIGAYLDHRGMRGAVLIETDTGFIVQGHVIETASASGAWGESMGQAIKETITLLDEDVAQFMEEAVARRGQPPEDEPKRYEQELRVIGRFLDERRPRDLFLFEQDGAYVLRLSSTSQGGLKHELVEFTAGDVADLLARAPSLRQEEKPAAPA